MSSPLSNSHRPVVYTSLSMFSVLGIFNVSLFSSLLADDSNTSL